MSKKSEARLFAKRRPFLGGREVQTHRPVHQEWFLFGSSSRRGFSSGSFYTSDISLAVLDEVGLSQLSCDDWLLAWCLVLSEAGLGDLTRLWGGELSTCLRGLLYLNWSSIWLCSLLCILGATQLIVVGHHLLLLSDKTSKAPCSSQTTPFC